MGIIIGKFRKKKSTYDVLEKLEQEIISIEEFGRSTEQTRKKIVGRFILLAFSVYIALALGLYVYYQRISSNQRLLCIVPLITFPFIVWVIKRFLTWYYSRKLRKNEKKLVTLKDEKKKILDNVMETETYKVAKKILDQFGNDNVKKPLAITAQESTPILNKTRVVVPSTSVRTSQTGLRQRNLALHSSVRERLSLERPQTPFRDRNMPALSASPIMPSRSSSGIRPTVPGALPPPGTLLPLPRSILPRDRSVLDKMVDYLVGDGPSNRYALICRQCNSHNGMSLKEEFEYLSFRCCYCSAFNPARKKRPTGPKFESNSLSLKALPPNSSDSDKNSGSESDTDAATPIIEPRRDSPEVGQSSNQKVSDSDTLVGDPLEISANVKNDENVELPSMDVREEQEDMKCEKTEQQAESGDGAVVD